METHRVYKPHSRAGPTPSSRRAAQNGPLGGFRYWVLILFCLSPDALAISPLTGLLLLYLGFWLCALMGFLCAWFLRARVRACTCVCVRVRACFYFFLLCSICFLLLFAFIFLVCFLKIKRLRVRQMGGPGKQGKSYQNMLYEKNYVQLKKWMYSS